MDDLEFRRFLLAEPNSKDEKFEQAKNESPERAKQARDAEILDFELAQALNVDVPEGLCEKLILRQTLASHQHKKKRSRAHLALAASVALVMGISYNFMFSSAHNNIGDYALAHVYHEAEYFTNNDASNVSLASLNSKMASFNGSFTSTLGDLIFADYCRFDGMKSLHLVLRGEKSPVNVFIVPDNEQLSFSPTFSDQVLSGETLGFKGKNVIIVGDKSESLDYWRTTIKNNIQFST